jgi:D-alanyl-D-alanine carboxypeptidase
MVGRANEARKGLRWAILALVVIVTVVAIGSDPADARRRKKFRGVGYTPPYAAIVVDVNSGQVLHSAQPDSLRHPASLTKIMTLYLLFEQLEAGKFSLDSRLPVSAHAASQAPSKLGLRPGMTISVEEGILALVTKSANDAAAVIGEAIAGDEEDFAKLMTRKARAIGMSRTVYTNASGLPDPDQVTTARDQATLGRAIQDRFPKYYRYFSTPRFNFRGRMIGNHNRLVGRVAGVDGIKTGYVRASGFNLVTSMRRDGRHVVGVVLGGVSSRARDARMRSLLEGHIQEASLRRTSPKLIELADAGSRAAMRVEQAEAPRSKPEPAGKPLMLQAAVPSPGSAEPIKPIVVRTLAVKKGGSITSAVGAAAGRAIVSAIEQAPAAAPGTLGTLPMRQQLASAGEITMSAPPEPRGPQRTLARGEWLIQIGAFPGETQAQERLKAAQSMARTVLGRAEPFTERVTKGETTLFRARFAGFDRDRAEAACKYLKRNEISCLALKN